MSTRPRNGWFHVVFNYINPGDGEGTRVVYDGRLVAGVLNKRSMDITEGDGRIAIGRLYSGSNVRAGSHEVDELILFNKALTNDEIAKLNRSNILNH